MDLGLCNMVFERGVVPEEWRNTVIIPLYKGKGERTECKNYRGVSLCYIDTIMWLEKYMRGS